MLRMEAHLSASIESMSLKYEPASEPLHMSDTLHRAQAAEMLRMEKHLSADAIASFRTQLTNSRISWYWSSPGPGTEPGDSVNCPTRLMTCLPLLARRQRC